MGNHDAIAPVVIRLANREIKFRVVCGSVPGEYDLLRLDSLAGSTEIIARIGIKDNPNHWEYVVKPCAAESGFPRFWCLNLGVVMATAVNWEKAKHAQI